MPGFELASSNSKLNLHPKAACIWTGGLFFFFKKRCMVAFRLILMRIRFRASDFGQISKTNLVLANRNSRLVRNRMRRWYSRHLFFCSCDSATVYCCRSVDPKNPSQRRLLLYLAPRRDALGVLRSATDSSIRACAD